ncbi:unnamed protein product [Hermetia illucens]|uniref:FHF complex subunit HOOK-interacting protein C-terminal domain-containing protein n=1 Tax=Hermetia illucens TaxID=343691 RepID=A0A7R8UIJ0_HERIL|nr:UPF0518 protein GJ17503 isoform X3 [Hermetia illucens]CAD7081204.1 unnamed protein product [Hermetia illucens]
MSWLRTSPLRQSLTRSAGSSGSVNGTRQRPIDAATDCDPRACYDSFCKHWQQAYEIIQRAEPQKPSAHDDVFGVVSHLDFMVTLLLVELHHCSKVTLPNSNQTPPAPCLEYLLSENLLDKLYEWGISTGRYANAVRLEQLKLYELLVSHSRHQLLVHEPFLRPLLKILASSQGEIFPPDIEKRLVILLNQLCVILMQNVHLLDLFFFSSSQQHGQGSTNFIIFSLLIPYVHREGTLGHQARDALLLCMSLSQKNSNVGTYIAQYSSMCPLLVTGLGGLYSRLPNTLEINSVDWNRITPDDVTEIPELTLFMNSLEFCNAVVQVAHDLIKQQLLDFMYQGFIVPVMGPALLQIFKGKHLQTNIESQISAMAYLDLIMRSVTEPGLLKVFIKFLFDEEKFDGQRIIDVLIDRVNSSDPNLCMVSLSLFDTLLSLHCEDIMLELLLKYLLPGKHIPISHRHKINKIDPYIDAVDFFMDLTPDVMKHAANINKSRLSTDSPSKSTSVQMPSVSKTIGANWNHYGLLSGDSLYSNYYAYLFEAHHRIAQCYSACSQWTSRYRYQKWPPKRSNGSNGQSFEKLTEMVRNFFAEFTLSPNANENAQSYDCDKNKYDSLQSIGESSGYESFKWRPDDDTDPLGVSFITPLSNTSCDLDDSQRKHSQEPSWKISSRKNESLVDLDFSEDLFTQGTVSLGPFLNSIWGKLQTFTSNSLYVNLHLTGLITRIAWYPLPLIHSILLRPDIATTSDTPSFHQVLRILKQQIDAELPVTEDSLEIIDVARSFLVDREFRLLNARKNAVESSKNPGKNGSSYNQTTYANISATTPPQLTPSSSYDPFRRSDPKRKSFSQSLANVFRRQNGSVQPTAQAPQGVSLTNSPVNVNQGGIPLRDTSAYSTASNSLNMSSVGATSSEPNSLDSLSSMTSTIGAIANTSGTERTRDLALCAVLLDEWLKELAAISHEQSIVMLAETF